MFARLPESDRVAAILALPAWRRVWAQRGDDSYIPHAATWLNGERWTDELPQGFAPASTAATVESKPAPFVRGPMPDAVRALIAKLKR